MQDPIRADDARQSRLSNPLLDLAVAGVEAQLKAWQAYQVEGTHFVAKRMRANLELLRSLGHCCEVQSMGDCQRAWLHAKRTMPRSGAGSSPRRSPLALATSPPWAGSSARVRRSCGPRFNRSRNPGPSHSPNPSRGFKLRLDHHLIADGEAPSLKDASAGVLPPASRTGPQVISL
jgi:hypothetical protein